MPLIPACWLAFCSVVCAVTYHFCYLFFLLNCLLYYYYYFLLQHAAGDVLIPWPGIEPRALAMKAQVLTTDHWGIPCHFWEHKGSRALGIGPECFAELVMLWQSCLSPTSECIFYTCALTGALNSFRWWPWYPRSRRELSPLPSSDFKGLKQKATHFAVPTRRTKGFPGGAVAKNLETQETWVRSRGQEDPLEKERATHSSILAWKIPWTEEPDGLQSMGLQRVRHNWSCTCTRSELGGSNSKKRYTTS